RGGASQTPKGPGSSGTALSLFDQFQSRLKVRRVIAILSPRHRGDRGQGFQPVFGRAAGLGQLAGANEIASARVAFRVTQAGERVWLGLATRFWCDLMRVPQIVARQQQSNERGSHGRL